MEYLIFTILRLCLPLTILRWPLAGGVLAIIIDALDWHFIPFKTESDYTYYQRWDKILDMYYLTLEAYVLSYFHQKTTRLIGYFLFFYRLFGVLLFEVTTLRYILLLFPNLFESYFLFLLFYKKISRKELYSTTSSLALLVPLIIVPRFFLEYSIHILNQPIWIFVINSFREQSIIMNESLILIGLTIIGITLFPSVKKYLFH